MSRLAAPQSAPAHRSCSRHHDTTSLSEASSKQGDITLVDLEDVESVITTVTDPDGDTVVTGGVARTKKTRCKTAPPAKSIDVPMEMNPGMKSPKRGVGSDSRSQSRASVASSRKSINRSGRKSRPQSTATSTGRDFRSPDRGTEYSSDVEDSHTTGTRGTSEIIDFGGTDIYNDNGWDTDLEEEDEVTSSYDRTGKTIYLDSCKNAKVIPVSYFIRHMFDSELEMKHHGLGPDGVKPLAVALVSNTHVLRLNLTDNWLGREGGHHICEMLKENCFISECDLSDNRLDYTFAEKFIDVVLNNSTLTHVTLSGNNFDDKAAVYLAEAIMTTGRIEYLNLSRNHLGESAGGILGPAIAENSSLRELDLSWNCLRRKGAVAVAQGIKNNILLQKVNLSWNGFGSDGAKALGDALKVNTTLEELDISNNRITTEGAVLLGKGLAASESLKHLKMGKNPMQSAGCYAVCAAITRNPNAIVERIDFTDIMVNSDFKDVYNKLKEQLPDLHLRHGGDGVPKRPKARVHPMVKLQNYIAKHNLKLLDFFNKFDSDGSMSVSREEFTEGIQETGIKLTDDEIASLLDELDKDGDGEINYSEMVMGHHDFTEKERKMAVTIMQYNR